jgi:hypothetical protein
VTGVNHQAVLAFSHLCGSTGTSGYKRVQEKEAGMGTMTKTLKQGQEAMRAAGSFIAHRPSFMQ